MRSTIHLVSRRDYFPLAAGVRDARRAWWLRLTPTPVLRFRNPRLPVDTSGMSQTLRSARTAAASAAAVGALIAGVFAGQDLWNYTQGLLNGWYEWARSGQGLWMLSCGLAEAALFAALVVAAARFLGPSKAA
jgi:hypothetical protein